MGPRAGQYIVEEPSEYLSREKGIISAGSYSACTVMGKVTASGKFVQLDPVATNGSQNAVAVLFDSVDASSGDKEGILTVSLTAVRASDLIWKDGITQAQKDAAVANLKANMIKLV